MKRMLINATHSEEIRVALADGQKLYNLDIDIPGQERKKGNIYKGKITRVEPSLEAAFVEYGANRHGFLPYKEISRNYYTAAANKMKERPPIAVAVKEGTEVIIQVNKEERGNKGAAISTYISLAGRYLVYMPENPKGGGISRRIEGKARQNLKAVLEKVKHPKNSGVIVRTAGIGRTAEELEWDLNYLDQVWTAINAVAATRKAPFFIYQESDIFIRAIRDYLRPDVGEILIDNKEIYEKARDFMQQVMPHNLKKLSYYNDSIPLFSRYQIEGQIQSAFSREVRLPSGGSIVIDQTEAMIAIDINSARATKGSDIEETDLKTTLEAADEIARQLRIRDLGGLVVIDFIDMRNSKNQKSVENQLDEALSDDRARIQTSKISRFGLLEMSRQRLRSSINETSQYACPRCSGHGFIRNIESLSVSILRIMEEEAQKPGTGKVVAQVPTKVANFITNEKRHEMADLESRHKVPMLVVANEFYQTPQFDIERLKKSEAKSVDINNIVLKKPANEEEIESTTIKALQQNRQVAAVDRLVPDSQVPSRKKDSGIIDWLKSLFASNSQPAIKTNKQQNKPQHSQSKNSPKKPQHKKPQHNNQNKNKQQDGNQQNKKPQHNNQNKNQNKNKQQNNKQQGKVPQHKNQGQSQSQNKGQKIQNNKNVQLVKKQNTQQPVKQQNNDVVIDDPKVNEQILQRPLGSVASYAANKSKKQGNEDVVNKTTGETADNSKANDTKTTSKGAPKATVSTPNKQSTQAKKPQSTEKTENTVDTNPEKQKDKTKLVETKQTLPKKAEKIAEPKTAGKKTSTAKVKVESDKVEPTEVESKKSTPKKEAKVDTKEKKTTTKKTSKKPAAKSRPKSEADKRPTAKKATKETAEKSVDKETSKAKPAKTSVKKTTTKSKVKTESKAPAKPKKKMPDPASGIDFDI
ncbi:MAG: Rne/Rng family ribonuclease [Proteobacteria bacterium]|nr:Rne/Rng family ribonuclease [Pseudomonadota bacterium]